MKKTRESSYILLQELDYFTPPIMSYKIPQVTSINNSLGFTDETHCETIYYNRTNERLSVRNNENSRYTVYALPNLQDLLAQLAAKKWGDQNSCKFMTNKIRFLVTTEKQLFFALEGTPNSIVPAHYQLSSDTKENAQCLTAGNIYLKQNATGFEIKKINHKSGDFTPCFDSLKWVLALLLAHESLLNNFIPDMLEIEALDANGGPKGSYFINKQEMTKLLAPHIQSVSQIPPCLDNRLGPDHYKSSSAPSLSSSDYDSQNPLELFSEILDESDSIKEDEIECFDTPKGKQALAKLWFTPIQPSNFNLNLRDFLNDSSDSLDFSPVSLT